MTLSVRDIQKSDIKNIVDYFIDADVDFLKGMGADKSKLPKRADWIDKLNVELKKTYTNKTFYYIIWCVNNQAVGHSNINNIQFGKSATMHLHLWKHDKRQKGLGFNFVSMTLPYYFENFQLKTLICEPYSKNLAPNRVLQKVGFTLIKTYNTTPGWINFHQTVNRYEIKRSQLSSTLHSF